MNNSFKANVKSPKLESSSKKKHQLVNPLLFRLDTIPSQSEVEPSDDDAEDIMRCSLKKKKKMKNKTMKDKTMCGQAPADQPTAIPDICHGRHGHTRVDFFWLV